LKVDLVLPAGAWSVVSTALSTKALLLNADLSIASEMAARSAGQPAKPV
jgi:hypothetical protein